jgi:uncharacterized repeat protein (TIGR02543 family)
MDADKSITANLSEISTNTYTLSNNTSGQGTVAGGGTYSEGTTVSVTATPDDGWQFVNWSGDASGTDNPLSVTMDADKSITANFSEVSGTITLTLQENEDGFCSVDGSIDNNNDGFSGDGFANTDNANGNGITWSVNIPTAGSYSFVWRYANGSSTDRTAQLMEDGSIILSSISMPGTNGWDQWTETSAVNANLSAGSKLIRLQATNSSGLSNIDYMEITGAGISAVGCAEESEYLSSSSISDKNVNIFPNPANNMLNFEFDKQPDGLVSIYLFSITGKLVKSLHTSDINCSLDISDLSKGLYLISISGSNLNIVKTIAKE